MGLFDKRTPAEKIRDTADALLQKGRYAEAYAQYAKLASTPELDDLQARCLLGMAKAAPEAEAADTRARARALLLRAVRGGEDASGQLLADAFGLTEFLAPLTPPKPESPVAASYRPQYLTALDAPDRPAARRQFEAAAAQGHEQAQKAMQKLFSDPA